MNLRIDEQLRRQLEAAAKERHITFSQEVRLRLTGAEPSLADFRADWVRRLRDVIEASAPKQDIEAAWRCLQLVDAESAKFYTNVERLLFPYVHDSKVRDLLRGAPTLSEHKPSQQERGAGGKK